MRLPWKRRGAGKNARTRARPAAEGRLIRDFLPPEGVPLKFEIAGLGARFGAQLADIALTLIGVVAVVILLEFGLEAPDELIGAVAAISFFMIRAPYYVLTELL